MDTPYSVKVLDEVTSTQDMARGEAKYGKAVVVIANRQTRGRGRSGTEWVTAPRAVAVSAAWPWGWERDRWSLIPLVAGVAARRALGEETGLKWPNDVVVGDEKVAGILVETSDDLIVTGLGVNLYWPDPPPNSAGLYGTDPGPRAGPELALEWAESVWEMMETGPEAWPGDEYRAACVTLGSEVAWEPQGRGRATDVGPDGSLRVLLSDGRTTSLTSGAVRHLRSRPDN